jgi:hypothetical protein
MTRAITAAFAVLWFSVAAHAQGVTIAIAPTAMTTMNNEIHRAKSPEEAAKQFSRLASELIGQAVADALQQTLGASAVATASNSSIAGWQQYILAGGMNLQMAWATPALMPAGILPAKAFTGRQPGPVPAALGASISITIGGTF